MQQSVFDLEKRFWKEYEPLRPELYRFCRSLTRNAFDAEDLVQEVMMRAFARLGYRHDGVANPRSFLFKCASNFWIDSIRRHTPELSATPIEQTSLPQSDLGDDVRAGLARLAHSLTPQERLAIILKEAFAFSLEETAAMLRTTTGTVKSALSRGREKLKDGLPPESAKQDMPDPKVLDEFVAAFNARDIDRLVRIVLPEAVIEVPGAFEGIGKDAAKGVIEHTWPNNDRLRAERAVYRDEAVVLYWYPAEAGDGEEVREVGRFATLAGNIIRWQGYYYTPELIAEVATELGLPFRVQQGHHGI